MSTTHGGRQKVFEWKLIGNNIRIENEDGRKHFYSLSETHTIVQWLRDNFEGWFPLANNVELMGRGIEKDGLGTAILNSSPGDITHAQGSSYLGVVLEEIGVLEWNGQKRGIQWRIAEMPESVSEFRDMIKSFFSGKQRSGKVMETEIHNIVLSPNGVDDSETLTLVEDVFSVWRCLHQSMPVIGPWFEDRIRWVLRQWFPDCHLASGQVFDPKQPEIRSRSWDIILTKDLSECQGLPAESSPESGPALVPIQYCLAVIDTKTNFSDPAGHAAKPVFNLANDETTPQLDFLGDKIPKIILSFTTNGSVKTLQERGTQCGLDVFALGSISSEPLSKGKDRRSRIRLDVGNEQGLLPSTTIQATDSKNGKLLEYLT